MNPDIKKFITGFLVLAALAGSASLILSNFDFSTASPIQNQKEASGSKNAFVESVPQDLTNGTDEITQNFEPKISDPSNMTEQLAALYSKELVKANPEGPQSAENLDGMSLYLPDKDLSALMAKVAVEKSIDSNVPTKPRILDHFSSDDVKNYFDNMKGVLSETFLSDKFVGSGADAQTGMMMADEAYNQALLTKTPKPLAAVQQNFIAAAYIHKKVYEAAADPDTDPLKSVFLINNAPEITTKTFSQVINSIDEIKLADLNPNASVWTRLTEQFDFKTANAQSVTGFAAGELTSLLFPILNSRPQMDACTAATAATDKAKQKVDDTIGKVTDAVDPTSILSGEIPVADKSLLKVMTKDACVNTKNKEINIKKTNEETFVQLFLGRIIDMVQNQMISWISGGGKPKFVTNWKGFLKDAGDEAAGIALNKYTPQLCGNLGIQMKAFFAPTPYINQTPPTCTLTSVKNNLLGFYNDFRSGGWVSYGQVIQPQNNYWGNLAITADYIQKQKDDAETAASKKTENGFKPVEKCVKWDFSSVHACTLGNDGKPDPDCTEVGPTCTDWQVVTPGSYISNQLGIAQKLKTDRLVGAKRLSDLVAALVDASFNRVMSMGLSQVSAAASSIGNSGSGYSNNYNTTADDSQYVQMGTNGAGNIIGDITQVQIDDASSTLGEAKQFDEEWLASQPNVLSGLDGVVTTCSASSQAVAQSATDKKTVVSNLSTTVNSELNRIGELLRSFANGTMLSGDQTEVQQIHDDASARLGDLQNTQSLIDINLASSSACSTTF